NPDVGSLAPAKLKRAQDVAHLGHLPARDRVKVGENAFLLRLFGGWLWSGLQSLRLTIRPVAFAESVILEREPSVIVERRAPEHRARRHHALTNRVHIAEMTFRCATAQLRHTQVA